MKDDSRQTVIVDENHHIRSVRLHPWNQRLKSAALTALNWRLLIKFAMAGAVVGAVLAWLW
jgi:hypothetical protein